MRNKPLKGILNKIRKSSPLNVIGTKHASIGTQTYMYDDPNLHGGVSKVMFVDPHDKFSIRQKTTDTHRRYKKGREADKLRKRSYRKYKV
tara:strand:- start:554 stop:823 length:270 start_codon:yes stop_codon:yes gene_type:complete